MNTFVPPVVQWGALTPVLIVFGAAVLGVLLEAFLPLRARRGVQTVLAIGALGASLVAVGWRWSVVQESGASELVGGAVIEDLPASERFFAGGDTTIRGFALDTVGAPDTITPRGFPTGGNAVLIMNGELRVPVWKEFGAAVFVDGGNVFRRVTQFDIGELRGSVGFGVRYRSPIGPVRVDLGFKLDRREIGGRLEPRTALHFSFGQAF